MIESGETSLDIRVVALEAQPPETVSITLDASLLRVDGDVALAVPGARFVLRIGAQRVEGVADQTGVLRVTVALRDTGGAIVTWSGEAAHGDLAVTGWGAIGLEKPRQVLRQAGVAAAALRASNPSAPKAPARRAPPPALVDPPRPDPAPEARPRAQRAPGPAPLEPAEGSAPPDSPPVARTAADHIEALCPMLQIRRGRFIMGASDDDPEAAPRERPQREIVLTRDFALGRAPVTQQLWVAVMGFNPSTFGGDERPVDSVSWEDAVAFCNALSARLGLTLAYVGRYGSMRCDAEGPGFRLPTEAEWEYACRAGGSAPRHGALDEVAWYDGNSGHATHPVGQKAPNRWGLHDMLGNVWEWCWDWRHPYEPGRLVDPAGPRLGAWRILRGGSWGNDAASARASSRGDWAPRVRGDVLGLRVCRTLPP